MKSSDILLLVGAAALLFLWKRPALIQSGPESVYYPDDSPAGGGGGEDFFIDDSLPFGVIPEAGDYYRSWMDRTAEEWAYKAAYGIFPMPDELME